MGQYRKYPRRFFLAFVLGTIPLVLVPATGARPPSKPPSTVSRRAAETCTAKVQKLQQFSTHPEGTAKHTTRFSEVELNSYLAFELSSEYHPSLKSLEIELEERKLSGTAAIDFDQLGMSARGALSKLVAKLFSGVHKLRVHGRLQAENGKAHFILEEAVFDNTTLPTFLVEEVITAVGRKQKPPFDPMKPSQMPYAIDRVEVHAGHIIIHQ